MMEEGVAKPKKGKPRNRERMPKSGSCVLGLEARRDDLRG
jgi:hypothetical protein